MKAIVSGVMVMGMQSTMYPRRRRLTLAFSSARQIFSMKVGVLQAAAAPPAAPAVTKERILGST